MLTHSHSPSGPSGRPPVSLHGLRTSLCLAFLAICAFFFFFLGALQQDRAHNPAALPTGMILLYAVFFLLPFAICFVLLSSRKVEFIAAGAGVACGFFGAFLVVSPYVLSLMALLLAMSAAWGKPGAEHALIAAGVALVAFLAANLAIVWLGARIGKTQWTTFGMAIGLTALYLLFSFSFLGSAGNSMVRQAQRDKEQADLNLNMPGMLASQRIVALAACLFQNHMRNPEAGYPEALEPPAKDWNCDTKFAADVVPEYTVTYVPEPDASGRVTNFELTAIPKAKGVNNRDPIMIDNRGLVFVYYPWWREDVVAKAMVRSNDLKYSQIDVLRRNVEQYIKDKNEGLAPTALNAYSVGSLGHEVPSIEDDGMRLETRDYETRYFPPHSGNVKEFALSAQCKSYGSNCLRSYFADYDGSIHATSEPRQATAGDSLAVRCEFAFGECPDVDWFP
jgi:hypothetical protein